MYMCFSGRRVERVAREATMQPDVYVTYVCMFQWTASGTRGSSGNSATWRVAADVSDVTAPVYSRYMEAPRVPEVTSTGSRATHIPVQVRVST